MAPGFALPNPALDAALPGTGAHRNDNKAEAQGGSTVEGTPHLDLQGFSGPLDLLLALARARRIDLRRIALPDLLDQLAPALRQAVPLAERGGWLVMAAFLVLLRSRLLLGDGLAEGATAPGQAGKRGALRQARHLQRRLLGLEQVQALAAWLDQQPQLGRDVFGRGAPGAPSHSARHEVDAVEFLWACVELLDGAATRANAAAAHAPQRPALHSVPDARARILRLLGNSSEPQPLRQLLPEPAPGREAAPPPPTAPRPPHDALLPRSAWASTFAASLELAKQGQVTLDQKEGFAPILVQAAPVRDAHHGDAQEARGKLAGLHEADR